jgi:hypothetical protein
MKQNTPILKASDTFKRHPVAFILGPALKMIEAAFDLMIPLFMKAIIDLSNNVINGNELFAGLSKVNRVFAQFIVMNGTWVQDQKLNFALIGGTYILLMGILGFATTMVTQYVAARTAVSCGRDIRDALYEKVLTLSKTDREGIGSNKLLTVLNNDSYQVQQGVLIFIRLIVRAPFIILGALIISFILYWQIGLVYVAITPLILLVIFLIMRRSSKEYLKIQEKLDELSSKTSETLDGAKVIRAFNSVEEENRSFAQKTTEYRQKATHVQKLNAMINPLTFAIIAIATVLVVIFGALPILGAGLEQAEKVNLSTTIITEIAYLSQILFTLVQLTNVVMILTKAKVSMGRVDEVLSIQPSILSKEGAKAFDILQGEEFLRFDHVSLGYKKEGNYALKDINFTLYKGQSLGIIGGTGSGKSTLISLIERFLDASEGTVYYKGKDIKDYPLTSLRDEISLVPQKSSLFNGTIRSNMLMACPNADDKEITKALKNACAEEFVSKFSDYLDHEVTEGGKNFSGGQRQRLCIARALVKGGEAIILDDSTSALDLLTDKTVRDNIANEYQNLSKIIVSQRVATVKDCSLILVLDGGRLIQSGTHESLLVHCDIYRETYESQTKKEAE